MLHRLLPLVLIIAIIGFVAFNFQSLRRDLAYKLNISGDPTTSCCDAETVAKSDGNFDENASGAIFNNKVIDYPKTSLAYGFSNSLAQQSESNQAVLGTTNEAGEEKWIDVSLEEQRLRAWEGNRLIMEFPI